MALAHILHLLAIIGTKCYSIEKNISADTERRAYEPRSKNCR